MRRYSQKEEAKKMEEKAGEKNGKNAGGKVKPKKILMVTSFYPPYHVGGACTHVYYLANELAKRGHEVHVLYSKDAYYLKRKHKPNSNNYVNHKNVHLHELKTPWGKFSPIYTYIFGVLPFKEKVLDLFNQKFDVIHYHNISLLGPKIFQYGNAKKIYTAHDHWLVCALNDFFTKGKICNNNIKQLGCSLCLIRNKRPVQIWRHTRMLAKALKKIDLIISPSTYLKNFLIKNSIDTPVLVLPNFISPPPKEIEENKLLEKNSYFFYAGMLEEIKGIHNLLKAFKDSDKGLIIAGKGSLERHVKNFIAKNKLKNRIIYVGWLEGDEIYSYYANALAFLLPSLCPENSPLTVLEAMSVGTPSIGSKIGGIPEIIKKIDKDLIFKYNDTLGLKRKADNFNKDKYDAEEIKDIYKKHFSADSYIEKYLEIINKL